jgi:hypothetical protein
MQILGIILIIYGILCILIGLLRPPFIMNMKKFQVFQKMLGKNGVIIFILVWGIAALVAGILIY